MSKGLKELRKLEKELSECYGCDIAYYPDTFEIFTNISNELKALETIKKHVGVIKGFIYTTDSQITESEYKLLCEVLRCDS